MSDFSLTSVTAPVASYPLSSTTSLLTNPMESGAGGNGSTNVDAVSRDFEAVFLSQMMEQMFSGDELTDFFGGGSTGEIYKSYMVNEYGKIMANAGGIGIASQVKQELLKLQEIGS